MESRQLFNLIHNAWDCYINAPLYYSDAHISEQLIKELYWFVCTSMAPTHKTILLGINPELAATLTGMMFAQPASDVQDSDIQGALGEIANIIAGSVKSEFSLDEQIEMPVHLRERYLLSEFAKLKIDAEVVAHSTGLAFYTALIDGIPLRDSALLECPVH